MGFLTIWIGTTIMSFIIDVGNKLRLYKDLADNGYKMNFSKTKNVASNLDPEGANIAFISKFIPIYNVLMTIGHTIEYNNSKEGIVRNLQILGLLEEMSDEEKEDYSKKPTGLNAYLVPIKSTVRKESEITFTIEVENETSEIIYNIKNDHHDIDILRVSGKMSEMPIDELKALISWTWERVFAEGYEKHGNIEDFLKELRNWENFNLKIRLYNAEKNETLDDDMPRDKIKEDLLNLKVSLQDQGENSLTVEDISEVMKELEAKQIDNRQEDTDAKPRVLRKNREPKK